MALGLALILGTATSVALAGPEYIRIASFNIADFGRENEHRRCLVGLATVLLETKADLICIQEVQLSERGRRAVENLVDVLNKAAKVMRTESYQCCVPEAYEGDERAAFIWRKPVSLASEPVLLPHDPDPDGNNRRVFTRVPYLAAFRARDCDFQVVSVHLYTAPTARAGLPYEGRTAECEALADWMRKAERNPEKDILLLGDFNRFLNGRAPWAKLMPDSHSASYRFPLLEAIHNAYPQFSPATDPAPQDRYSTTTAGTPAIYDQFIISKGCYREFTEHPVFAEDVGLVAFDDKYDGEWWMKDWCPTVLSDHRPIWIRLRVDLPDDDP